MSRIAAVPLTLTCAQLRDVDRRAVADNGMTGLVLMENAGRGAAELLQELRIHGPVVICCGKGNNAGDGFVIARHLENSGHDVRVLLAVPASSLAADAATNFNILQRAGTPIVEPVADIASSWRDELARADWIVDALLGTGTQGAVRDPFTQAIAAINNAERKVLAVDLPSGMEGDMGVVQGYCVCALHTATFVARKPAFERPGASEYTGEIHILDIGVPRRLLREISESSSVPSGPSG